MKTTKKEHTATILQNIFIAILVVIIIGGVFGTIKLTIEYTKSEINNYSLYKASYSGSFYKKIIYFDSYIIINNRYLFYDKNKNFLGEIVVNGDNLFIEKR